MNQRNFFAELKRRNVFRAGAFYAACAWLLVQVATSQILSYGGLKLLPLWDPLPGDPRFEKIVASLAPKEK